MTKIYVHSNNKKKIEKLIELGKEKFGFNIKIAENFILSSDLCLSINTNSTNIEKDKKFKKLENS